MLIGWIGVALAAPLAQPEPAAVPTVITSVAVLRADGSIESDRDVWLADGRIASITPAGSEAPFAVERTIDGTGATLMPGLSDLHVHIPATTAVPGHIRLPSPRDNLDALLFAGVTTVFDLGASLDEVAWWNDQVAKGRWAGPEIVGTGKPFGAPEGHPRTSVTSTFPSPLVRMATKHIAWEVETTADVEAAWAAEGERPFAKVMLDSLPPGVPTISDEALARLRSITSAGGTRLLAHVGRSSDIDRALALPVDALAHSPHTGAISASQAHDLAAKQIPVIPTLAVWQAVQDVAEATTEIGPLEHAILSDSLVQDFERTAAGKTPIEGALAEWAGGLAEGEATRLGNVRTLHDAGVTVLVGSDSPSLGLTAGAATHRELALLVEAGLSEAEVLAAATRGNLAFLDPEAAWGIVAAGYEADLLLVRGDPTRDITATTDIAAVWVDGRFVERRPRR